MTSIRRQRRFRVLALMLALLAVAVPAARGEVIPTLQSVTPHPTNGTHVWTYSVDLYARQTISSSGLIPGAIHPRDETGATRDYFTIHDFSGFVPGSNTQPAGWGFLAYTFGANSAAVVPQEDNTTLNLTWYRTGSDVVGPAQFTFSVESISSSRGLSSFASDATRSTLGTPADGIYVSTTGSVVTASAIEESDPISNPTTAALQATAIPVLQSIVESPLGGYTWTYSADIAGQAGTKPGPGFTATDLPHVIADYFTIFDFGGFIPGSNSQPDGWEFAAYVLGSSPSTTIPVDSPLIPNLTWYRTTDATTSGLGSFSARSSIYNLGRSGLFVMDTTRHNPGQLDDGTGIQSIGAVTVPGGVRGVTLSEPGAVFLFGIAALALILIGGSGARSGRMRHRTHIRLSVSISEL